jgi:hypothetical protein
MNKFIVFKSDPKDDNYIVFYSMEKPSIKHRMKFNSQYLSMKGSMTIMKMTESEYEELRGRSSF